MTTCKSCGKQWTAEEIDGKTAVDANTEYTWYVCSCGGYIKTKHEDGPDRETDDEEEDDRDTLTMSVAEPIALEEQSVIRLRRGLYVELYTDVLGRSGTRATTNPSLAHVFDTAEAAREYAINHIEPAL